MLPTLSTSTQILSLIAADDHDDSDKDFNKLIPILIPEEALGAMELLQTVGLSVLLCELMLMIQYRNLTVRVLQMTFSSGRNGRGV